MASWASPKLLDPAPPAPPPPVPPPTAPLACLSSSTPTKLPEHLLESVRSCKRVGRRLATLVQTGGSRNPRAFQQGRPQSKRAKWNTFSDGRVSTSSCCSRGEPLYRAQVDAADVCQRASGRSWTRQDICGPWTQPPIGLGIDRPWPTASESRASPGPDQRSSSKTGKAGWSNEA